MLTAPETGRILIGHLAMAGVTDFVISPGSRNAPLALAVAARPDDFRLHVRIDERTAAFLALGLSRGSGRPAAVLCSSGTATANYHPAVIEADAAGVPLIVVTADRPVELRGTGANQTIDQVGLYGRAVRWFDDVIGSAAEDVGHHVRNAVTAATGPWPGPVHLNVPLPEPLLDPPPPAVLTLDGGPTAGGEPTTLPTESSRSIAPDPGDTTAEVPPTLLGGRRTVVVAGEGALAGQSTDTRDKTAERILDAAERLGIPVIAEPTSGLRTRPDVIRTGHWLASAPDFLAVNQPDVVLQLGRPVLSRAITAMIDAADIVVMCDPLQRGWDPGQSVTHRLTESVVSWLGDASPQAPEFARAWAAADQVAGTTVDELLDGAKISELGMTREVAQAVPDGGQLVVASSLVIRHLNEVMLPRPGLRVLGNRGASGIDGFLSTAVGAALGHDGPTVALAGDLSVIHDLTGLVIGPDEPVPPLPIVVINNDGGGIFHLLPYGTRVPAAPFRRLFTTPHSVPLEGLASTMGHRYTAVDTITEVARAMADAWATPGITLIEVTTDTPTESARYHTIRDAVAAALTSV
ncbi:2-succinyl-5-enolpyruvyl-6-hydroxy-3-cyclohexene-1-carboxylic-acid synthase [Euzebya tangerina]|uniref:2-succinyl-5-enolpyruvyl-6-hydroxy-3- cyclohexene-1-carboxylic-acid synthase n=1 Tax=Euzebya tangerina TaxID=591198 RepID=UPI000E323959|nr:2-succinyl-5-enolpyruvyl-6-hydroxy-3-cyclohexene-1-carboxylic-acid synthase [Euzebya tangerina]